MVSPKGRLHHPKTSAAKSQTSKRPSEIVFFSVGFDKRCMNRIQVLESPWGAKWRFLNGVPKKHQAGVNLLDMELYLLFYCWPKMSDTWGKLWNRLRCRSPKDVQCHVCTFDILLHTFLVIGVWPSKKSCLARGLLFLALVLGRPCISSCKDPQRNIAMSLKGILTHWDL